MIVERRRPGAEVQEGGTAFRVWAPFAERVDLELEGARTRLEPLGDGWHGATEQAGPGARYGFSLDGGEVLPDPASGWQPEGVHGRSAVAPRGHGWSDAGWRGIPLGQLVLYELHVGTFTGAGTFDAVIPRLPELAELGVTALELMPVAEFPGGRNWGYDGVFPYAAQSTYGGPEGLMRLVDAAHAAGLAVCLDVVYNHLGPEGNVLGRYGPYFTDRYRTPWGQAVNVDGPDSDAVRGYLVGNALRWFETFHIDALRLDAVHAIADQSAVPFLAELADATAELAERLGRPLHLIAESDLNDPRMITPRAAGGLGMDAQWSDDFHHALHRLLTGESRGYYTDFRDPGALAKAMRDGFVFDGERSVYRRRRHGAGSRGLPGKRFVVYSQNHDQVGNRMAGDRLIETAGEDAARVAAVAVLTAPFLPLLFMGEEHGERRPFPYFVSHTDAELVEAVRTGRAEEFSGFEWGGEPPDPQSERTFESAVLDWEARSRPGGEAMLELYRTLLRLRRERPSLRRLDPGRVETALAPGTTWVGRRCEGDEALICLHTAESAADLELPRAGAWSVAVDTSGTLAAGTEVEGSVHVPGRCALVLLREVGDA
ncbi:MAG TPA: malto-oligosyltrehalose trehalohydrolase [Gaiellales bacterium]|nr:malto-oligosyltrehalose trehalohydrolase [Gaiellales bacterium]